MWQEPHHDLLMQLPPFWTECHCIPSNCSNLFWVGFLVANGNYRIERGCEVPRKWSQVIHNAYNQKGSNETMHRIKWLGDRLEK